MRGRRFFRAASTAIVGAWASPSLAQAPEDRSPQHDIIVTGTRILRDSDAPLTATGTFPVAELLQTTTTGVPDALNKLPQFQLSSSPSRSTHNFANSANHGNILNLRGIGGIRTLILLDGLRVAPSTYRGEVDVDVLPGLLVRRVDVVTTGASAAYGSDAVSGAVNFVLDTRFDGVKAIAQSGISERGDNAHARFGVVVGMPVSGGGGRMIVSAEVADSDGMRRSDRADGRRGFVFAGATGLGLPGSASNPLVIRADGRLTVASQYGKITGPPGNPFVNYVVRADGALAPFDPGIATGTPGFATGGDGFAIPATSTAIAATRSRKAFGRFSHAVSPDVDVFAQVGLGQLDETYVSLANSFLDPTPARLFSGNSYLPAAIQQSLTGPDDAITLARYGGAEPAPRTRERTRFIMATAGAEGSFGAAIRWKAAYTLSRSTHDVAQAGLWDWQRTYAAIDAVRDGGGVIVCRATLDPDPAIRSRFAACRPLNLLVSGEAFTAQPGYAYGVGASRYRAALGQDAAMLQLNGSPFRIRDRPVDVAVGAEYRRQTLDLTSNADPARLQSPADRASYFAGLRGVSPSALTYWLTNVGTASGRVNVGEVFAEAAAPLSAALTVNAAGRVTHYSTSGAEVTWKAGVQWQMTRGLLLRAGRSRDSRAPSLFELFAGQQSGIGLLVDPQSGLTGNVTSISGGNRALRPERSTSSGFGAVVTPPGLPGLTMSVDYYRLKVRGQIDSLSITRIAQNCFASGGAAPECALIDQPDPTRLPTSVRTVPINTAFLDTAGIDIDAAWRAQLGGGDIVVRLNATVLERFRTEQYAGAPVLDFAGYGQSANQPIGRPRVRGTLNLDYAVNDFGLSLSQQYIGRLKIGSQEPNQNYNGLAVGPVLYTDASLRRKLPGCRCRAELFFTVNNVFDRSPPLVPGTTPGLNFPTIISLYDVVGRTFSAGVRIDL
jgi:iron complex outermembrane recepter protein